MTKRLEKGTVVAGQVQQLLPFGLLVKIDGGPLAVVREREIAWERDRRRDWRQRFAPGHHVRAVVLGVGNGGRLELSLRLVANDPWLELPGRYHGGQIVSGTVTGIQQYGVFVEIEAGVVGLVHCSCLPAPIRTAIPDFFWPGDHVRVEIETIDRAQRRVGLRLVRLNEHRWPAAGHTSAPTAPCAMGVGREPRAEDLPARLPLELFLFQKKMLSILIVEDDPAQAGAVADWLRNAGQRVVVAGNGPDALAHTADECPDLILMDLGLPGMDGIEALRHIYKRWPEARAVITTDWARADQRMAEIEQLYQQGASLLIKPLLPEDLLAVLIDDQGPGQDSVLGEIDVTSDRLIGEPGTGAGGVRALQQIDETCGLLARLAGAAQVVLFALDPAERRVRIIAEHGAHKLRPDAMVDLVYSPVRDVAEDGRVVCIEDTDQARGRVRYLRPLLPFRSCLGIPVSGDLPEQYALFLFSPDMAAFDDVAVDHARAAALALGALLEYTLLQDRVVEIQRFALLGHLSRALVHEINHQLSPVGFALGGLEDQCSRIEKLADVAPGDVEGEVRAARGTLQDLAQAVRNLIETARLFGQVTVQAKEQLLRLDSVVDEVVRLVADMADRAGVTLHVVRPPAMMFTRAQAVHVQQMLLNVVINAIQQIAVLRPDGQGRVEICLEHSRVDDNVVLQVSVEDDGPGIHRRLWERIFELGFTTRRDEGSGLGLYITRCLADALGGRVYVADSHILWGTTIVIELPVRL